ncbi:hypothetical protein Patl1_33322 [Pistacia atlantica]|uniref:Uncharacterized protein n=1 Tax=Pistacia atlantica TaxID=434234 RepID=A0ACC0ZRA8_9ROSI|nr:hypothetical protein Patl1_33322 [Pistacia atlantica]
MCKMMAASVIGIDLQLLVGILCVLAVTVNDQNQGKQVLPLVHLKPYVGKLCWCTVQKMLQGTKVWIPGSWMSMIRIGENARV